jgi:hypothetical protein
VKEFGMHKNSAKCKMQHGWFQIIAVDQLSFVHFHFQKIKEPLTKLKFSVEFHVGLFQYKFDRAETYPKFRVLQIFQNLVNWSTQFL